MRKFALIFTTEEKNIRKSAGNKNIFECTSIWSICVAYYKEWVIELNNFDLFSIVGLNQLD